jgi:hypothetical protein
LMMSWRYARELLRCKTVFFVALTPLRFNQ